MSFAGVSIAGNGETTGHAINVTTNRGYHLLVVDCTKGTKHKSIPTRCIRSLPFMVGGHRWCIRYYPNGNRAASAGWVSLFLVLDENIMEALKVPPCSIHQHISDLLVSKEGTDVTFKVEGETFAAHRCVLAARSAVFKTELFGTMKEGTISSIIHVEDMEAKVFGALLSFIYTDSLPRMEVDMVEEGQVEEALWLQHLLAAADRYDLRRLKVLCEEKLCEHIDMSSVTTILTLAEQHNCRGLKEVCFEFLKTPANLKAITAVDGLEDITRTCPSLLKELITKLAS
ncbi:BTB/POZ and MATH domain-containing protein 1-like [Lolium rigidum]|uniref:BTB/POZ and MATH domain-containing protein 1-like n=1 Tax=Lolium rigidum TaxID=89674 RepID=UPI001F5DD7B6|nr:BTB/POZ and MATH domain-containing protein 1-like [Lolium rigidum]